MTEFAPISSSGHLILVPWLFDWPILRDESLNKTFDVALHVGTFVGGIAYFRRDIATYLGAWIRSIRARSIRTVDERLAWGLVVGTAPGVVVGAAAEDLISEQLGAPWLIAVVLTLFGVVLYAVDRVARQTRSIEDVGIGHALVVGTAQALALQPGVSRSGVTITAARALGLERESAARFSFLLALPIIGGAGVFQALQTALGGQEIPPNFVWPFVWGMVAAAVSGFVVIQVLLAYLRTRDFLPFMLYRLGAAGLVLGVIAAGLRPGNI